LALFLGYFASHLCCGKKAGQRGKIPPINKIRLKKKGQQKLVFHFHHYLMSLLAMVILFATHVQNFLTWGFLTGAFIQGIFYKDFHKIFYWEEDPSISQKIW
jgi:hypothetical protein